MGDYLYLILISSTSDCNIFHNFLSELKKKLFKKRNPFHAAKNAAQWCRYCCAVVLRWDIKHFDFQKLAGLWLAGKVVNHVGIYGSKAGWGFLNVPTSVLYLFSETKSPHIEPWPPNSWNSASDWTLILL